MKSNKTIIVCDCCGREVVRTENKYPPSMMLQCHGNPLNWDICRTCHDAIRSAVIEISKEARQNPKTTLITEDD